VSKEEHRKVKARERAVERANAKKQERARKKREEAAKSQKEDNAPEVEVATDTVRRTQLWFLEYEIARMREHVDARMKKMSAAISRMDEVLTHDYAKLLHGSDNEVAIVKMHAKMCQGPMEVEALTAGGCILTCVGDTDDGDIEEQTEWKELLQANNEHREEIHDGVVATRKANLNSAAKKGKVFMFNLHPSYKAATAARHVALEMMQWRAKTLQSKDQDLVPESIAHTKLGDVSIPVPPENRNGEQVKALIFRWMEDGRWSAEYCSQTQQGATARKRWEKGNGFKGTAMDGNAGVRDQECG
jgi:hypothetical protein